MSTESNRFFGLVTSGVGERGARSCSLWKSKYAWLDVKEQTTASNNWIDCNFKPFKGHKFMTSTKYDQLCDPPTPSISKNEQIFCLIYFFRDNGSSFINWTSINRWFLQFSLTQSNRKCKSFHFTWLCMI